MARKLKTETNRLIFQNVQIIEVRTVNQFEASWSDLINEYNAPSAICGYISFAVALNLANQYPMSSFSQDEVEEMIESVSNKQNIRPIVKVLMESLKEDRTNYLQQNSGKKKLNAKKYLSNWVANYEIGDWLSNLFPLTQNLHFLRCIERGKVSDEEYDRCLLEDFKFLDYKVFIESLPPPSSQSNRKNQHIGIFSGAKELPRLIEPILSHFQLPLDFPSSFNKSLLFTAHQWLQFQREISNSFNPLENTPIFIVDGLGHYVVAKPIDLEGSNCLLVFNSMEGNISKKFMFTLLAKILFLNQSELSDPSFLEIL